MAILYDTLVDNYHLPVGRSDTSHRVHRTDDDAQPSYPGLSTYYIIITKLFEHLRLE